MLYCPKRVSYQYVTVIINSNIIIIIISQGYETSVKLAVLDHNAHLQRNHITKQDGTKVYHRKYRKQTKKWDVTPVLEEKYEYIPEIMECVRVMRHSIFAP